MKKSWLNYFENNVTELFCRKFDEIFRIYSKFYLKYLLPVIVPVLPDSFQFAAEDHQKGTVCGHNGRPDSGWKKINGRKIKAQSVMQIAAPC